jgi:hypothetical protein
MNVITLTSPLELNSEVPNNTPELNTTTDITKKVASSLL